MVSNRTYEELEIIKQLMTVAAIAITPDGIIEDCNMAFIEQFIVTSGDILETCLYEYIPSKELREQIEDLNSSKATAKELVFSFMQNMHSLRWCQAEIVLLKDRGCYVIVLRDLTGEYQTQMILQAHLIVSNDLFLFFDSQDHILQCSNKAAVLFGFATGLDAIGMHYTTLMQGKVEESVLQTVFEQIHLQENYLGFIKMSEFAEESYYEVSAFHVYLQSISTGVVLLLRPLREGEMLEDKDILTPPILREKDDWDRQQRQSTLLFWGSKECRDALQDLSVALLHYEYIEINRLLEELSLLAPSKAYTSLQSIQSAINEFQYEQAYRVFEDANFLKEE